MAFSLFAFFPSSAPTCSHACRPKDFHSLLLCAGSLSRLDVFFVKVWMRVHDWESLSDRLQVGVALLEVGVVREGIDVFLDHFVAELILLLWRKAGGNELRRT